MGKGVVLMKNIKNKNLIDKHSTRVTLMYMSVGVILLISNIIGSIILSIIIKEFILCRM